MAAAGTTDMTYDKVIEFLELYPEIDGNIRFLKRLIKDINDEYYMPIQGTSYDGLPKGKNNISRTTEDLALNIPEDVTEDLKNYERRIEEYYKLKSEILQELSRLKYRQKTILFDKYVNRLIWEQVAVRNHYSARQCKNIRKEAIEVLIKRFASNQTISKFKI